MSETDRNYNAAMTALYSKNVPQLQNEWIDNNLQIDMRTPSTKIKHTKPKGFIQGSLYCSSMASAVHQSKLKDPALQRGSKPGPLSPATLLPQN